MFQITYLPDYNGIKIEHLSKKGLYAILEFVFQPIVKSLTEECVAYELLSKVTSQSGDCLESEDFFYYLNDELIKKIVLSQVYCLKKTFYPYHDMLVSINIPLSCLSDISFVYTLLNEAPHNLALEINIINEDPLDPNLSKNIRLIKDKGHQLWLDDYLCDSNIGTFILDAIDWDIIKIDKSYLLYNSHDKELISSLISVLMNYARKIVFEGVETDIQSKIIRHCNTYAQGYYYGYPEKILTLSCFAN